MIKCDYYGCEKPIRKEDESITDGHTLRFCEEHGAELDAVIAGLDANGPAPMLRFWIKAGGGHKRMADST